MSVSIKNILKYQKILGKGKIQEYMSKISEYIRKYQKGIESLPQTLIFSP